MTRIDDVEVTVYRFPPPYQDDKGTRRAAIEAVVVGVTARGRQGIGWTYAPQAAATLVREEFAPLLCGRSAIDINTARFAMYRHAGPLSKPGEPLAQAISAVDIALWDLKAQLLGVALADLFRLHRTHIPVYGSGGFTDDPLKQLDHEVAEWSAMGCRAMKIKIGADPSMDVRRLRRFAAAAGPGVQLMVDAAGAYPLQHARLMGHVLDQFGVSWFEDPVAGHDPGAVADLRAGVDCDVAAGGNGWPIVELIKSVDCLQLDATTCGGYSGFLLYAALAEHYGIPVSARGAPALHAPIASAVPNLRHLEWPTDHARIERMLVDHAPTVNNGVVAVPVNRPGHGMRLLDPPISGSELVAATNRYHGSWDLARRQ